MGASFFRSVLTLELKAPCVFLARLKVLVSDRSRTPVAHAPCSPGIATFERGAIQSRLARPFGVEDARLVRSLIRVRSEQVTLALDQVRRQSLGPVAVEVRQRRGERRHRNALRQRKA